MCLLLVGRFRSVKLLLGQSHPSFCTTSEVNSSLGAEIHTSRQNAGYLRALVFYHSRVTAMEILHERSRNSTPE